MLATSLHCWYGVQHLPPIDGDELLAAMGKVALPEEEYEALLVDAIVNGATPDN